MCLIVFAWRPGHAVPLLVAANRDEFYARPSAALAHWDEQPGIYAGRDLQAGGTWLGVGPQGRFAALTNLRDPAQPLGARSRGELPAGFLSSQLPPAEFLAELQSKASEFSGFNLLVGSA
ncbi:MAG: NRDE family protein, partial [Pseudomonas sp.]|nr:NRDE family protein [Pseudomonas sp.]